MKGLSLWQPWAWLVVNGHKDIENRKWRLPRTFQVPQRVYIHAGLSMATLRPDDLEWIQEQLPDDGTMDVLLASEWPRGFLVGEATITGCVRESDSRWFEGPYGFTLVGSVADSNPVPYKGATLFFAVDDR